MSDCASVLIPIGPAAFSPLCGMLIDRFGVTWIIAFEPGQTHAAG